MNMLTNSAVQQLDEAGLYSPVDLLHPAVTQDAIDAGVRKGRLLRSQAFHQAVRKLMAPLNGSDKGAR